MGKRQLFGVAQAVPTLPNLISFEVRGSKSDLIRCDVPNQVGGGAMADYINAHSELDSELIIGIVSAVGTENGLLIDLLKERLGRAGYCVELIKVSSQVIPLLRDVPPYNNDNFTRINDLMTAGNKARSIPTGNYPNGDDAVLALGVATRIFAQRRKDPKGRPAPLPKTAFIVDSLKRPEEVERMRLIYPSGFILIGVHEEESRRSRHLTEDLGLSPENAKKLIVRDAEEGTIEHGQRVSKTFHLADFFVRISDNHDRLRCDVQRMVELWFGNPLITPTFDEHAMFLAFSAALRSADLSRQVGAVVTIDSQILSTGANDCPKAGGGLYWPERRAGDGCISDLERGRDHTRREGDSNVHQQNQIIDQLVEEGMKAGLDEAKLRRLLNRSRIRDLTEYGRVVHAEMEALLSCSRNGISTIGASLYCTTFPCHNCAKHIIAAGLERVVYIEPYPKSKTLEFHDDSIRTTRPNPSQQVKLVEFSPFVGIGPRRFFDLFSMTLGSSYPLIRKERESGAKKLWTIENAQLRIQMKPASYLELEAEACKLFGTIPPLEEGQEGMP
jgi:deoxycytidylate deaminase